MEAPYGQTKQSEDAAVQQAILEIFLAAPIPKHVKLPSTSKVVVLRDKIDKIK